MSPSWDGMVNAGSDGRRGRRGVFDEGEVIPPLPTRLPAVRRENAANDQLRTSSFHSTPVAARWTWLAAVHLTGSVAGAGGTIMEWGYYSFGPAGTQAGWKVTWSVVDPGDDVVTLELFDDTHAAGPSFNRSDATEPDLTALAEPMILAVTMDALGDVTFRAIIGEDLLDGPAFSGGIAVSSPEVLPLYEMYQSEGALAWALTDTEVTDEQLLSMSRTLDGPSVLANSLGAYVAGRRFDGAEGEDLVDVDDIVAEGSDAASYTFAITAGAGALVKTAA